MFRIRAVALAVLLAPPAAIVGCTFNDDGGGHDQPDPSGPIQGEGWTLLGERRVDGPGDTDQIRISSDRKYRKLRLEVDRGGVIITRFDVKLKSGTVVPFSVGTLRPGEAREIDLPGDDRTLSRVDFAYSNTGKQLGRISLYGR
jgi:hypothetical protein